MLINVSTLEEALLKICARVARDEVCESVRQDVREKLVTACILSRSLNPLIFPADAVARSYDNVRLREHR
jgi:hypothetical protein